MFDVPPGHLGVVIKDHKPLLLEGTAQDPPFRLERDQRLDVVPHDPRERQVGDRRHQVAEQHGALAARLQQDALMVRCVAGGGNDPDPGDDIALAVHEVESTRFVDRHEVVVEVAGRRSLVDVRRVVVLTGLHDIPGVGEGQANRTLTVPIGIAAGMIEVQVRVDHDRDVIGRESRGLEPVLEGGAPIGTAVLNAVNVLKLRRLPCCRVPSR